MLWVLDYVPFLPMSPLKLFLVLWVLLPNFQGESIVYLAMSEHLNDLHTKVLELMTTVVSASLLWFISLTD
jgi:hypothetical protein